MAKRLNQEQKMQKAMEERITSERLEEQVEAFLNSGGEIDKIASGESGMKPYSFQKTMMQNSNSPSSTSTVKLAK